MDYATIQKMAGRFAETFGSAEGLMFSRAPGRVNLIGEHTDYNGGFVLPMAVDREVRIFFRPVDCGPVRVWSENYGEWDEFDLDSGIEPNPTQSWSNYVRGVAKIMLDAGRSVRPFEGVIYGDVPLGAGLSSSAAIEVACALALCGSADAIDRRELALLCQKAENTFVGVNCGIMDQFVSLHAEEARAVMIDCRSLDYELLPLDTTKVRVIVANTMVHHELGASAYNERRATCEAAAAALGVEQLRDVSVEALQAGMGRLDPVQQRRARHVVSEDERVRSAVNALTDGDYAAFGALMNASHDSLDADYEVTCEELNTMVDVARRQPGVLGARMTGGGFGGCTVNLVECDAAARFASCVAADYGEATGIKPELYEFGAVRGAEVARL